MSGRDKVGRERRGGPAGQQRPAVLAALGWDTDWQAAFAPFASERLRPGRVVRTDRGVWDVLTVDGPIRATMAGEGLARLAADPAAMPCTGDWVAVRDWPDGLATVAAVLPRRTAVVTAVVRVAASGHSYGQVLAANLDLVGVVVSLADEPDLALLGRFLTLAWESGAAPLVILTKSDLAPHAAAIADEVGEAAPGVPVLTVSARTGDGLPEVTATAWGRTTALIGSSGAGRSTLANALVGADTLPTREVRADGKPPHPTARRELVLLPGGGALIDTPGLRGVGRYDVPGGLLRALPDVDGFAAGCRFAEHARESEPDQADPRARGLRRR